MKRWIAMAGAAAVIALILVIVGVGGSSTETVPSSTITEAAAATSATSDFRMALNGSMKLPTVNRTIPIAGSGVMDSRNRTGSLSMSFSGLPSLPGGTRIDEVFSNYTIYMHSPLLQRGLPGGKAWIRFDLRAAGRQFGIDPSQMSMDPTKALDQLRAIGGGVSRVGSESVRGVATTHYRGTVDLRRYPSLVPSGRRAAARQGVDRLIKVTGTSKFPEDVWIDAHRHIRRLAFEFQMRVPNAPGDSKVSMKLQEELYDFGAPVRVTVPPADQTVDGNKLARQAQGGVAAP